MSARTTGLVCAILLAGCQLYARVSRCMGGNATLRTAVGSLDWPPRGPELRLLL